MKKVIVNYTAMLPHEHKHAQHVMRDIGITYEVSHADSMCDRWIFYNCGGLTKKKMSNLPVYIKVFDMTDDDYETSGLRKIKRFSFDTSGQLKESDTGYYCLYSDIEVKDKKIEKLRKTIEQTQSVVEYLSGEDSAIKLNRETFTKLNEATRIIESLGYNWNGDKWGVDE